MSAPARVVGKTAELLDVLRAGWTVHGPSPGAATWADTLYRAQGPDGEQRTFGPQCGSTLKRLRLAYVERGTGRMVLR